MNKLDERIEEEHAELERARTERARKKFCDNILSLEETKMRIRQRAAWVLSPPAIATD